MGAGLQRVCKAFGGITTGDVRWVWDYAQDCAVRDGEMPQGSDRWKASERAKWEAIKAEHERATATPAGDEGAAK
jgi:hypothetical protein